MAPVSVDSQDKKTNAFKLRAKILKFTTYVQTEKLICKSIVYIQCFNLEA